MKTGCELLGPENAEDEVRKERLASQMEGLQSLNVEDEF